MGNSSGKNYPRRHSGTGSNAKRVHWGGAALPSAPGKPILIPASSEDTQPDIVGIRWERSPSNGGSAIVGYQVEHRRLGSPYWVRSSPGLCSFPELTLTGLEPGWRYQFRVRARNGVGLSEPSVISDPLTVTLQRSAASPPRFDLELADTVALENEQAEFTVHFSGSPLPKISWFKDGFEIFSSRRTRIITENGKSQLLIHQTALNDEGEIKCTATNRAGHVSTKAKLSLEAPPKIRLPRQYEDGLLFEQDETIRLKVSLAGRPPPTVTWYHDGEIVIADTGHVLEATETGECALRIGSAKRQDRGEYTVRASNKLGDDAASFLVTVTDRPASPGKATIVMTLGRSVTLAWREPEDDGGCKIGTYIVEYYRIGWDMWLKAATCRQTTTTLGELIEGSEYRFRIKAENPYGVSEPSEESDVIFIPDPKRGINAPPKRPEKTQSQHEIRRGRGQDRRDDRYDESAKRTRSLTRGETIRGDAYEGGPPTRSASAQRLPGPPVPPSRPSRADSRVTFADTVYLHVEKNLEDPTAPVRSKTKKDRSSKNEKVDPERPEDGATEATPTFDDSGGREEPDGRGSPSPEQKSFLASSPRESLELEVEDDEGENSEFMLVLYPKVNSPEGKHREADKASDDPDPVDGNEPRPAPPGSVPDYYDSDDDLVAPPMSLSLPELFSADHQVIEVLREAVSSTELLHERAMERFYRAVALEEAETAKKSTNPTDSVITVGMTETGLSPVSVRLRNARSRRSGSGAGSPVQGAKVARNRRRSSEGPASLKTMATPRLQPTPEIVASDPNLQDPGQSPGTSPGLVDDERSPLHRWHLGNVTLEPKVTGGDLGLQGHMDPDDLGTQMANVNDAEPMEDEEESDSSDDMRMLKARILAQPIVDEEDTYHPHGRPIARSTSLDAAQDVTIQPKSILKKRVDDEPPALNRFGRPIPPELPLPEKARNDHQESAASSGKTGAGPGERGKSIAQMLPKKSSFEEQEDLQARMAVIDHYTEIVREYSIAHSVNPARKSARTAMVGEHQDGRMMESDADRPSMMVGREIESGDDRTGGMYGREPRPGGTSSGHLGASSLASPLTASRMAPGPSLAPQSPEISRPSRPRKSRPDSPGHRSRTSSTESTRKSSIPTSRERSIEPGAPATRSRGVRGTSRDSSRTRKDRSVSRTRRTTRTRSRERSTSDPESVARSRRPGQSKMPSRRNSSGRSKDESPGRSITRMADNRDHLDTRLVLEATRKIRSSVSYATDLTLLIAALYVYLFKREILAIPIIGLLLYRRVQEDLHAWIPKRWRSAPNP